MPPCPVLVTPATGCGTICRFYTVKTMSILESLKIDLAGLAEGATAFSFDLGDDYFEAVGGGEVKGGAVRLELTASRSGAMVRLGFHTEGTVVVPCDICLDDMEQAVCADNTLTARIGEEYSEDDDLITVGKGDPLLDVSWFVYESIALSLPVRHVHAPGKCNPAMIKVLEEHSAARSGEGDAEEAVDSRWSELEKLKTTLKD